MNLFLDAAERISWTFAAGFFGTLLASPVFANLGLGWQDALKVAVFAGGLSAVKVVAAIAASKDSGGQLLPGPSTVEVKPDTPSP